MELHNRQDNTAIEMVADARKAIDSIRKGSKLRMHYLTLVVMNNVFRAFVTMYELDPKYKLAQESLLKVLCDMEGRKNRVILRNEYILLDIAHDLYEEILISTEDHQLREMLLLVDAKRDEGKWLVTHRKN